MLTLKPVMPEFKISTTDLKVVYTESDGVKVEVGAIPLKNPQNIDWEKCVNIEICFPLVAEAKCVTVPFYENHYNGYHIDVPDQEKFHHLGFYEVVNSTYLQENVKKYDPKNRLGLRHYMITGYDGYVELIASTFSVNE
ncbi:hypothetical protein [Paenibacillus alvei]|uniref:hypothetical protein n=1 Tax=Paenibacillus alvei TaxID=44250 RepID=UPI000385C993|nr:hypothetical protein [Paenibacillus alvei]EPY14489.1 hypothetical protein PAAL66ix_02186 [Paenibacillus alvei A6-6i-x]